MPLPFALIPIVSALARVAPAVVSAVTRAAPVVSQAAARVIPAVKSVKAVAPVAALGAAAIVKTANVISQSQQTVKPTQPKPKPAPIKPAGNSGGGSGPTDTKPSTAAAEQPADTSLPAAEAAPATVSEAPVAAPVVVKSANIETILFNDEEFSSEFLVDLLFESVAGQELLTIARNDTVNGQDVVYQPIKNLNILQDTYNPTKLLAIYDTSESFFGAFAIDLRSKIPLVGTGVGGKNYYLTSLGDLVIEVVNIANDEQVEFQVADSGTIEELGI